MHTPQASSTIQANKATDLHVPNNFVHTKNHAAKKLLQKNDFEMGSKFPSTQIF